MQQELYLIYGSSLQKNIYISNSGNTGTISGGGNKGGIIAHANQGTNINKCYNTGKITGETGIYIGGIIGRADDCDITNSYNIGDITCKGTYVGGIMGRSEGSNGQITQCYNIGNISSYNEYSKTYGGIAGTGNLRIDQCYNAGKIKSTEDNTELGGIAGYISKTITNSYNLGKIEIEGHKALAIGGITGRASNSAALENCYNIGEIEYKENITSGYIGGICGDYGSGGDINNVYNIGKLTNIISNNGMIGAIIGAENNKKAEKIYYLKGTYSVVSGTKNTTITTEQIETLEAMKTKLNSNLATLEGWKEDTNNINDGYPILSWQ